QRHPAGNRGSNERAADAARVPAALDQRRDGVDAPAVRRLLLGGGIIRIVGLLRAGLGVAALVPAPAVAALATPAVLAAVPVAAATVVIAEAAAHDPEDGDLGVVDPLLEGGGVVGREVAG